MYTMSCMSCSFVKSIFHLQQSLADEFLKWDILGNRPEVFERVNAIKNDKEKEIPQMKADYWHINSQMYLVAYKYLKCTNSKSTSYL